MSNSNDSPTVRVVCRVRPENAKEKHLGKRCVNVKNNKIILTEGNNDHDFNFDDIFGPTEKNTQLDVFNGVGEPAIKALLSGYNSTILAYGQTSSGKTHTMQVFYLVIILIGSFN